jgi:hypothetical protein
LVSTAEAICLQYQMDRAVLEVQKRLLKKRLGTRETR